MARSLARAALWFCACNLLAAALAAQCSNPTQVPNQTIGSGTANYSDNNALAASNVVINGSASVTFYAGNCIDLQPGFHATAGSAGTTFHAWVGTAPPGTVATPTFGVAPGTYTSVQTVGISTATTGATIRYTTDGSTPSETAGTVYSGPVTVGSSMTIRAMAYKSGWTDSAVAPAAYTINLAPPPAMLSITSSHTGVFTQGQSNATYTLTVANGTSAGATNGAVAVTEIVPSGLIPVGMQGAGWTCTGATCVRSDALATGSSYPAITLTVNVANHAPASVTNTAAVAGGGSANASASDPTTIDAIQRYSDPLAFAVPASVVGGVPTTFTVTYASQAGSGDIAGGQVEIDSCYLAWDSSGNVTLYPGMSGRMGQSATLQETSCSINLAYSTLSPVAGNPYQMKLSLAITFPEQANGTDFFGTHEVYAWGTNAAGLTTVQVDLGAMVVSPGPDFTLTVSPSGSTTIPYLSYATLTVTATGLNGFTGGIGLTIGPAPGSTNTCFSVGLPANITAGSQVTGAVTNNCIYGGQATQFVITGYAQSIGVSRAGSSSPTLVPAAGGDFTITPGIPLPSSLPAGGSIQYPVTVTSIGGQSGYVNLALAPPAGGSMPAGVTYQLAPTQVYLSGSGTAQSTLTLYSTASTPGGASPLVITGTLQATGAQRTAAFSLGTQVTTFQVNSLTGSAIVHNTGQEVQVTQNVPAGNAPGYTTCDTADPDVTCRMISASARAVTLGITARKGAARGVRLLRFDAFAAIAQLTIADDPVVGELSVSGVSSIQLPVAEGGIDVEVSASDGTYYTCVYDNYCDAAVEVVDQLGREVSWPVYFFQHFADNGISVTLSPGSGDAGNDSLMVGWWRPYQYDEVEIETAYEIGYTSLPVLAPAPVITSITSLGGPARGPVGGSIDVVISGNHFTPNPAVNASGITVSIISFNDTVIHATFTVPVSQPGGNAGVTVTVGTQGSNQVNFYVQVPTSLVRQTYPGNPPAGAPNGYGPLETPDGTTANGTVVNAWGQVMALPPNQCGVYRNLAYLIVDQEPSPQVIQGLNNVQVSEAFSDFSGTSPTPPDPQPFDLANCPGGIGSSQCFADVTDTMYLGHTNTCLAENENQSFTQAFSVTIGTSPSRQFSLTTTNSVSRGNFNGTLKADVTISKP